MATEIKRDPDLEWLDYVRPVGLVVAPVLLKELGLVPERQTQAETAQVAALIGEVDDKPALSDPWPFMRDVLGWQAEYVAGSPGGPELPDELNVRLPEQSTTLTPTWAVKELGDGGAPWQLLIRIEPSGIDPDARGTADGWEATAHQRFERLLRESGIFAGVLISERSEKKDGAERFIPELRIVYAPKGETSGYASFPLRDLRSVAGRPMLGGLKLLLDSVRLFADGSERRLPALLLKSREAQAAVSTELAEQVLGALHELLRGFDAATPDLVRELARQKPGHLYEGLLTVLMRLVFVLYAEDRDLLPSRTDGRSQALYEAGYSLRGLYERLTQDAALNPDTMDERRGGWGRLLALFQLIHKGHPSHFIQARGGKLFDPQQFPFLEGRGDLGAAPRVPPVSDGCILRVLEGLMTLAAKGGARERLSYRTLDVEQIGSVYETVMGFRAEVTQGHSLAIRAGKNSRTPVFVNLEKLATLKGKERIKYLKEDADRGQLSAGISKAVEAAKNVSELAAALDAIVDERGSPKKHVLVEGVPILQPTDERRRTGSHYTPRALTAPIVEHALAPTFERLGPDATPEQILDLKVCDPAMGSGAFLVEACRALAARLVGAWARYPKRKPVIPSDEDEELHARRLVAQRCLYGVDKNPLATDLAKLSLWLATLARDHEFSFLDHALKSGDSLIGLSHVQIAAAHWDVSQPGLPLFQRLVKDRVDEAMSARAEIQAAPDDTARAIQEARHSSLEERLKEVRLMGDTVVAAFFAENKPKEREKKRASVESWLGGAPVAWAKLAGMAATLKQGEHPLTPFHWYIEFPEVFLRNNPGFDAIVGNPPFAQKNLVSQSYGSSFVDLILLQHVKSNGRADLCAFFFRQAFALIRCGGAFGLIATNTIAQGDTREAGLQPICETGGRIICAQRRMKWPGAAAVVVSVVHVLKLSIGSSAPLPILDGRRVSRISAFLFQGDQDTTPSPLLVNRGRAFHGVDPSGPGFTFDDSAPGAHSISIMNEIVELNSTYAQRISPYIGGSEINSSPRQAPHRFIIDLQVYDLAEAQAQYPKLVELLRTSVKKDREARPRNKQSQYLAERWWLWHSGRPRLQKVLSRLERVLVNCQVGPHLAFVFQSTDRQFSLTLNVFSLEEDAAFCILQSRTHEVWARSFGSTMKDDLRYTTSDCFDTFPFVVDFEASRALEAAGQIYDKWRAALMVARNEGMTKTYNRFHDASETGDDIQRLRDLHAAMDRAVLEAYGWNDLAERASPIFLNESNEDDHTYQGRLFWPSEFRDEVLARLLALNAERHADEVHRGLAPGRASKDEDSEEDVQND